MGRIKSTYFVTWKNKKEQRKYERMGMTQSAQNYFEWAMNNDRLIFHEIV